MPAQFSRRNVLGKFFLLEMLTFMPTDKYLSMNFFEPNGSSVV